MKITFLKPATAEPFHLAYFPGDSVDLDDTLAKKLIKAELAEKYKPVKESPPVPEEKKVLVKFLRHGASYSFSYFTGDVVEIPESKARKLIEARAVIKVKPSDIPNPKPQKNPETEETMRVVFLRNTAGTGFGYMDGQIGKLPKTQALRLIAEEVALELENEDDYKALSKAHGFTDRIGLK